MTTLPELIENFSPTGPYNTPSNWLQGRTSYGGLSAAMALHAAMQQVPSSLPPLRSAQFAFVGPMAEGITFDAHVLRQGKSATSMAVDAHVDGQTALRSTLFFANERSSAISHALTIAPCVNAPDQYAPPTDAAYLPSFFCNFDVRFTSAAMPVSAASEPELAAWVKLKGADHVDPQVALLAIGDCLPPAAMASFVTSAPISSMNWAVELVNSPRDISGWFLLRSRSLHAGHGYSHQLMEVWDEHGQLLMAGTQTVALFC